jgi:CRP/FNR family transcriptional regulator, cyclic AMP receptor protein
MAAPSSVRLLEVLPELGEHLSAADREEACRVLEVPTIDLARGSWQREELARGGRQPFGALVVNGLLSRTLDVGGQPGLVLHGPTDMVAVREVRRAKPGVETWRAELRTEVALLDDRFLVTARRWPRLVTGLFDRLQEQHERLMVHIAIAGQSRVEDRLLLLFRELAARMGRVTPEGVSLFLPLTHEALGCLVGARRPTVSLALQQLASRGALLRRPDRTWMLPPEEEPEARYAVDADEALISSR